MDLNRNERFKKTCRRVHSEELSFLPPYMGRLLVENFCFYTAHDFHQNCVQSERMFITISFFSRENVVNVRKKNIKIKKDNRCRMLETPALKNVL
jgi:hypothetical protein